MFRNQSEELVSNVSFYILAEWRIKPHNVLFLFPLAGARDINIV